MARIGGGGLTLDDEKPLPPSVAEFAVQLEDTCRDEASESGGQDVTRVEDGDSSGDFRSGVEVGNDQDSARVLYRLSATGE